MKTIAIMNQKGGIGKTMTAASIAYLLGEEQGKKVLLVDADQQAMYQCCMTDINRKGSGCLNYWKDTEASEDLTRQQT